MTKADIVAEIAEKTGLEKVDVQTTLEAFMKEVKSQNRSSCMKFVVIQIYLS